MLKRIVAAIGLLCAVPGDALACPNCASNAGGSIARGLMLSVFVMFPFAVVGAVIRIIQKHQE